MKPDDHSKSWHLVHSAGVSNSANLFDSIARAVETALARERRETAERCAALAEGKYEVGKPQMPLVIAQQIRAEFGLEGK